ncbi:MAG: nucleotide exchange factor GrpE [Bacilli bacterium]
MNEEKVKKTVTHKPSKKEIELQNSINELSDKNIRLSAEFVNYRNRTQIETSDLLKYEGVDFIKNLLPIVDNFERAIMMDNTDLSDEVSKFLEGFKMIYSSLMSILEENEIKAIDALGHEFDPTCMEAVLTDNIKEKPANVVLEVLQKGYKYKGKVIRNAMVKVNN